MKSGELAFERLGRQRATVVFANAGLRSPARKLDVDHETGYDAAGCAEEAQA
jgi:hypothetical protein